MVFRPSATTRCSPQTILWPSVPSRASASRRRVPDDVSVIGFNNIDYASAIAPELTTIAQPIAKIGATVIKVLLAQIHDPASPPESIVLEPSLIERESCRVVK